MPGDETTFIGVAPVLAVDDITESIAFYRDKLGFTVDFTWGDPPHYAVARRGANVSVHLSEREDTTNPIAPACVYIFVTDADALYEEFTAREIDIFQPPQDEDYGMREFEVRDLNGHFLTFGQDLG